MATLDVFVHHLFLKHLFPLKELDSRNKPLGFPEGRDEKKTTSLFYISEQKTVEKFVMLCDAHHLEVPEVRDMMSPNS